MTSDKKCSNCGHFMENAGDMSFREVGYTGFGGMYLGGWSAADNMQAFSLFRCPNCGKVDFYEPSR
ncbi:MAG: nucleotide-binding protein [Thaumarchaeota archaeon]|nr:nucleotide-binding protein [Nitrososphaerota archaeon]